MPNICKNNVHVNQDFFKDLVQLPKDQKKGHHFWNRF